jgi:hypothetical protein
VHYARHGLGCGYELVPISVESFGRLGAPSHTLLCRIADVAGDGGGAPKAAFIRSALQEMSVTLCKGKGASPACASYAGRSGQWTRA